MATELKAIADWLLKAKVGVIRNIQEDAECKEYSYILIFFTKHFD